MCAAWATMRPWPSKTAALRSRRSLMLGETAVRMQTAAISSATLSSRSRVSASATGLLALRVMRASATGVSRP